MLNVDEILLTNVDEILNGVERCGSDVIRLWLDRKMEEWMGKNRKMVERWTFFYIF